jgi:hypothetical protein
MMTQEPYLLIKEPLLSLFTSSPLQICFKLLDLPRLGECRPSVPFAEMLSLLPRDVNILFNAMFLRRLPETMLTTLADRGELLLGELAAAADLLLFTLLPWRPPPRLALRRLTRGHPSRARHILIGFPFLRLCHNAAAGHLPPTLRPALHPHRSSLSSLYHYNFGCRARNRQPPCPWQGLSS